MLEYLRTHKQAFSPEEVSVLIAAFDKAWQSVSQHLHGGADATREFLAKRIVDTAKRGVLDKDALSRDALDHLAATLLKALRSRNAS